MKLEGQSEVTRLLAACNDGDPQAMSRLAALVYDELRALAGRLLRNKPGGETLRTTALVNEAYVRLAGASPGSHDAGAGGGWEGRSHFFSVAAKAMRSILVDHARRAKAAKRGGGAGRVPLDEAIAVFDDRQLGLLELDEALTRLSAIDERKSRLVELRFFGGLEAQEAAAVLGVSESTAERDWRMARAWLYRELSDSPSSPPSDF